MVVMLVAVVVRVMRTIRTFDRGGDLTGMACPRRSAWPKGPKGPRPLHGPRQTERGTYRTLVVGIRSPLGLLPRLCPRYLLGTAS